MERYGTREELNNILQSAWMLGASGKVEKTDSDNISCNSKIMLETSDR